MDKQQEEKQNVFQEKDPEILLAGFKVTVDKYGNVISEFDGIRPDDIVTAFSELLPEEENIFVYAGVARIMQAHLRGMNKALNEYVDEMNK